MRLALLGLAMMACRAGRAPSPPLPTRTPYLVLFERGRTWSLPIEQATGREQAGGWTITSTERGTLSCTTTDVQQVGDGDVARVACAAPYTSMLISGTWVATPAGLYHPYLPVDEPDDLALLGEDDLLIAAIPKEREHRRAVDNATDSVESFPLDGSWCVRQSTTAPILHRSFTLCFGTTGVTGGGELVVGEGELTRARFGSAPPDVDDPGVADGGD